MENAIQLLADYFDHGGGTVSSRRLNSVFGANAAFLLETSIFGSAGGHADAPCRCPEGDHAATVSWNEARAAYRARCAKGDRYWMDPADAETHAFDSAAFCREVGRALGVAPLKGRNTSDDRVRYSGDAMLGKTPYPVLFVRGALSPETLDIVLDFDERNIGKTRGVFLCATLPVKILRRDSFHAFAAFSDVLDLQDGQLRRRPEALRRALGDAVVRLTPLESDEKLRALAEQYALEHGKLPSADKLKDYAAKFWPEDQTTPGRTRCSEALKNVRVSGS